MRRVFVALCALTGGCLDPNNLPPMTYEIDEGDLWRTPPGPGAPAPGEGRALITNNLDDTVTIVDLDSLEAGAPEVIDTVPVGFVPVEREGPHHCAIDADAKYGYVGLSNFVPGSGSGPHGVHGSGSADGHVLKIDVATGRLVKDVRIDRNPGDVRLTPDGKKLLATHFDMLRVQEADNEGITSGPELASKLAIVDLESFTRDALVETCPAAHGIAITADSKKAVTSCNDDTAVIVDIASREVTHVQLLDEPGTALVPVCGPYAVTLDDEVAWISCYQSGQIIEVDIATGERTGRDRQLPGAAVFGHAQDGQMAVAFQRDQDGIAFLTDGAIDEIRTLTGECDHPHLARFSEDGASVFVVCEGNKADPGLLLVLQNAPGYAAVGSVALGRFPDDLAIARRPE